MRILVVFASIIAAGAVMAQTTFPPQWTQVSEFYVNTGPPRQYIGPVFVQTAAGYGPPAGTWIEIDLTQAPWNVPANAKAAYLTGLMIITHGTTQELAAHGAIFRAPGDTRVTCDTPNFIGQAIEAQGPQTLPPGSVPDNILGGGQRSGLSTFVPLINGKVEFCWTRNTEGAYPEHSAYGINLAVQAWVR